jgi:hypothetical protein
MTLGWASAWTWALDLTLVIAALAVILSLTAVLRLLPLLRHRDDAHAMAGPPSRDRLPARQAPLS